MENLLKYTGSYAGTECNFVISNLNTDKKINDHVLYSILCVVQNIILRGKVSLPSKYLIDQLGFPTVFCNKTGDYCANLSKSCNQKPCDIEDSLLMPRRNADWSIIKGDRENVDYPAQVFYDDPLENLLYSISTSEFDYRFVKKLFIPEAKIEDVLGYSTKLDGQQVDLYLPQIRTVIEVDGWSHSTSDQIKKDSLRDEALKKANIDVIRIATSEIKNNEKTIKPKLEKLANKIIKSEVIKSYVSDANETNIYFDTILRLQVLLLECFKSGALSLNDEFCINIIDSDVKNMEMLIEFAYVDLCLWIENIARLAKYRIIMPELVLKKISNSIDIDFSIYDKYWDVHSENTNTIYIRNDYYYDANNFRISHADSIQYKFAVKEQEIAEDDKALYYLLENTFGFKSFKDGQLQIIKHFLERKDTIGILPTGGGKSLTYQFSSLLQPGIALVIVPIVSLMQDQKRSMDKVHIDHTAAISSQQNGDEKSSILNEMLSGKYHMVWSSPERFQNKEFRKTLSKINRDLSFATCILDEVHCLSEWGHDFRVSYLALINTIKEYCPEAILLGLTATASQAVLEDLKVEFGVDGSAIKAIPSMERKELNFKRIITRNLENKEEEIADIIQKNNVDYITEGKVKHKLGLIFCQTVGGKKNASVDNVIKELAERHFERFATYNGRMTMEERANVQEEFMQDNYDLIVCTKAFGMGIDKDNVKYTIHTSLPQSVESFYQEAGRAGREEDKSTKSDCYILYSPEDENNSEIVKKIFNRNTTIEDRQRLSKSLSKDLSTIMFFWNSNRKTVEEEYKSIRRVLAYLYNDIFEINFKENEMPLESIQAALYKLSLIGIVSNWTIKYHTLKDGIVEVQYNGIDEEKIRKHLIDYIQKYEPEFNLSKRTERNRYYYDILNEPKSKPVAQCIKVLIEWSNNNVIYNRLQSTYTMMQWMNPKISDKEFRDNIVEYFRFSERSILLDGIIQDPKAYNIWFDVLYDFDPKTNKRLKPLERKDAKKVLPTLSRYLESYDNNTGLNYCSGMLRIMAGEYLDSEGEDRLKDAFVYIHDEMSGSDEIAIITRSMEVLAEYDIQCKEFLSEAINMSIGNMYSHILYETFHDNCSLYYMIEKPVNELTRVIKENY